MKIAVFLLLIGQSVYAQNVNDNLRKFGFSLNSLIEGEWTLNRTEVYNGSIYDSDTSKIITEGTGNHKISFTSDSLYNLHDTTLRYYIRQKNYAYKIVYDSIYENSEIKLFSGKKGKQKEVESYEILKCTFDELVIKSFHFLDDGLDFTKITVVYVYRKNDNSELYNQLMNNTWFNCSNQQRSFLYENDSLSYVFNNYNDQSDLNCQEKITISFNQKDFRNSIYYTHSSSYEGIMGGILVDGIEYMVDFKNNMIYFDTSDPKAYTIELLTDENLVISLNKKITDELNKAQKLEEQKR